MNKNLYYAIFFISVGFLGLIDSYEAISIYLDSGDISFKMSSKNILEHGERALVLYLVEIVLSLLMIFLGLTYFGKNKKIKPDS